jgi:hypothetical protein
MRIIVWICLIVSSCAQTSEVIALTADESARITPLHNDLVKAEQAFEEAKKELVFRSEMLCQEVQKIKAAHDGMPVSGQCGTGSRVLISNGRWEIDKTMKFLIHR